LIDPGETAEATALREAAEETGVHGRPLGKLGDVRYWYVWEEERVFKVVFFFLLRYGGGRLGDRSAKWPNGIVPLGERGRMIDGRCPRSR
jgi:8-oxo-dGTP pyrophosphatase MutT (NUDIX family)